MGAKRYSGDRIRCHTLVHVHLYGFIEGEKVTFELTPDYSFPYNYYLYPTRKITTRGIIYN
jgi:hypothetical protein